MKKIIIIAVLFCLSAMTFKAEAELKKIPDKDFEKIFVQFQKDLKETEGYISIIYLLDEYVDRTEMGKDYEGFAYFVQWLTFGYKDICKLSKNNKYRFGGWELNYDIYDWAKNQYTLDCSFGDLGLICYFNKINGKWKITNFGLVG